VSRITYGELLRRSRTIPARKSAAAQGYDASWRRTRERILARQPLCVDCEAAGRVTPAVEVHHRVKLSVDPRRKHDPENLVPLCTSCHSKRTKAGE
jgi:5-methylcytosine-specific restriction enzyme A